MLHRSSKYAIRHSCLKGFFISPSPRPFCIFRLMCLWVISQIYLFSILNTIVHAYVCTRIVYWDFLLVRLFEVQSEVNIAARLISQLPECFHMSAFIAEQRHWSPPLAESSFEASLWSYASPLSATSFKPLQSSAGLLCSRCKNVRGSF